MYDVCIYSINPEAGNHAVPVDAREISAAIGCWSVCREEFPFIDDVTENAENDLPIVTRLGWQRSQNSPFLFNFFRLHGSVVFLPVGACLASPLRDSFFCLHKELIKAIPDNRTEYDKLTEAASWLKTERLRHVPSEIFESLCHSFVAKTENESDGKMKRNGFFDCFGSER